MRTLRWAMKMLSSPHWIVGTAWVAAVIATLLLAVPSRMSVATFLWVNAAILSVAGIVVASLRAAGPTRSIAHVLYDTEHQGGDRR